MNQEMFVNKYIELLNATVAEAIHKNMVLQAQKTVLETQFNELLNEREEMRKLVNHVDTFRNDLTKARMELDNMRNDIKEKDAHINSLLSKINEHEESLKAPVQVEEKPIDKGNTWTKKVPAKKKTTPKQEVIKDAGKF